MARQRKVVSRQGAGTQVVCERPSRLGRKPPVHGGDRHVGLPGRRAFGAPSRKFKLLPERGRRPVRRGERHPRAEVHEQRARMLRCDEGRVARRHRVADDDDRPAHVLERLERRADAVRVRRLRIVEGEIGRDRPVAARFEALDQRLPAGTVVPVAMEETEGGHVTFAPGRRPESPGRSSPDSCRSPATAG